MKYHVLVFPCGSQNGVDLNFALRHSLRIKVFGASSVEDHGSFVYKNYIGDLPNINEAIFIERLNEVLLYNKIDFIIPTHDTVALFLKSKEESIQAKIITSPLETVELCRYKSKIYNRLQNSDYVPAFYHESTEVVNYPVFLKPDSGQGGKGTFLAFSEQEIDFYKKKDPDLLIVEYLPGEELTVDCFTDKEGQLRYAFPRVRDRTLGGISTRTTLNFEDTYLETAKAIADRLNQEMSFQGYWYFQLKKDASGQFKLLEISVRTAGSSSVQVGLDINLALLTVLDFAGEPIKIQPNSYAATVDRSLLNRFQLDFEYDTVYVDLDDTLILEGQVNGFLMMFLYQCRNHDKKIFLLSKHAYNISETLTSLCISQDLFDKVVIISSHHKKSDYMDFTHAAIFIDNSFAERAEVRSALGIPAFDVNSVEALIDWRG